MRGGVFVHGYLLKVEGVGEIGTNQVWDNLLVVILAGHCLCLPILPKFHLYILYVCVGEQPLYPLEGRVHTGQLKG